MKRLVAFSICVLVSLLPSGRRASVTYASLAPSTITSVAPLLGKNESASVYDPKTDSLYRWYLFATILGVGGGLVGLVFLIKSANAAKKAAEVAEQTLRLTQGAEIVLDEISIIDPSGNMGIQPHGQIVLVFKNFGHTKATDVDIKIGLLVETVKDVPPTIDLPRLTIAANDTRTMKFQPMARIFEQHVLAGIANGDLKMRFEGTVTYKNVFGETIVLECKGMYLAPTRTFAFE